MLQVQVDSGTDRGDAEFELVGGIVDQRVMSGRVSAPPGSGDRS